MKHSSMDLASATDSRNALVGTTFALKPTQLVAFCGTPLPSVLPVSRFASKCKRTPSRLTMTERNASFPQTANPVLRPSSPSSPSTWDSGDVYGPVIYRYLTAEGFSYAMWYSATPRLTPTESSSIIKPRSIGLALSDNGISWRRVPGPLDGKVLGPNEEDWWWFDTKHVQVGDIVMTDNDRVRADSGVYFMYYCGGDAEVVQVPHQGGHKDVAGIRTRIGLALSKDGEHFTRLEGEHPSGAILEPGPPGSFDELYVASPTVTRPSRPKRKEHKYILHYHTFDTRSQQFVIGRAISKDGFWFERDQDKPVLTGMSGTDEMPAFAAKGVSRRSVVERTVAKGKRFVMFVECIGEDSVHRIGISESDDCMTWGAISIVLTPSDGDLWDSGGVSHPRALEMDDGSIRLYYVGQPKKQRDTQRNREMCIGLVHSNGTDWTNLQRVDLIMA